MASPNSRAAKSYNGVAMPCKSCRTAVDGVRRAANIDTIRARERTRTLRKYGLTHEQYKEMYAEQDSRCACCRDPIEMFSKKTHIDHDHKTMEIRGILCHYCNVIEGLLKGSVDRAMLMLAYMERNLERTVNGNARI